MSLALNLTGRPMLFQMCDWGTSSPWLYGKGVRDWLMPVGHQCLNPLLVTMPIFSVLPFLAAFKPI